MLEMLSQRIDQACTCALQVTIEDYMSEFEGASAAPAGARGSAAWPHS